MKTNTARIVHISSVTFVVAFFVLAVLVLFLALTQPSMAAYGPSDSGGNGGTGSGMMGGGSGSSGGGEMGGGGSGGTTEPGSGSGGGEEGDAEDGGGTPPTTPPKGGGSAGGGSGSGGGGSGGGGGEDGEETAGNNLSFPVVAADGFAIPLISDFSWEKVYEGPYTGLSVAERLLLEGHSWYAQKTEGNVWQAEFAVNPAGESVPVYGVDWGDIVEAVNPIVGRPFRLEVTLYHQLRQPLQGFNMALLAFPSSPNESQGTNRARFASQFATVVSPKPAVVIQDISDVDVEELEWNGEAWENNGEELPATPLSFGAELNVGGKYIFGASKGGWKPEDAGEYRITFYLPESDISLSEAIVGNYADWVAGPTEEESEEARAATPVVDREHNITYADVTVATKREGSKPENPGEGEEEASATLPVDATSLALPATDDATCVPYLTDYLGIGLDNDPDQVVLLQSFLNEVLGTNIPLTGYFGTMTFDAVKLFQETYAVEILQPWIDAGHEVSLTEGTGYVYITTLAAINEMVCAK